MTYEFTYAGKVYESQAVSWIASTASQCDECAFLDRDDPCRAADKVHSCIDSPRIRWVVKKADPLIEKLKSQGWTLESQVPLQRFQNRIVQAVSPGEDPDNGVVEQYAVNVPAGIFAWRYPPPPQPLPRVTPPIRIEAVSNGAASSLNEKSKPTNPKDAIGIRKAPMSALPMNVIAEMGAGLLEGAAKYGRHNYRGVGVRASVYFDATMRHLIAWWEGEDEDRDTCDVDEDGNPIPGTGLSHVAKALCSLAVLRDAQMQGKCTDDRPPRSVEFYPELNRLAGQILDRHAGKEVKHYTIEDEV